MKQLLFSWTYYLTNCILVLWNGLNRATNFWKLHYFSNQVLLTTLLTYTIQRVPLKPNCAMDFVYHLLFHVMEHVWTWLSTKTELNYMDPQPAHWYQIGIQRSSTFIKNFWMEIYLCSLKVLQSQILITFGEVELRKTYYQKYLKCWVIQIHNLVYAYLEILVAMALAY